MTPLPIPAPVVGGCQTPVMTVTATQLENYWPKHKDSCPRRWVFRSVKRLPTSMKGSSSFGDVMHKVIERYLRSDEKGTDPKTGQAVNLYPKDWDLGVDRFGKTGTRISLREQDNVRTLIQVAKDKGLLVRHQGREIEAPFKIMLPLGDGTAVLMDGHRDLVVRPNEVTDHKSSKDRRYKISKKRLLRDPQMLFYSLATWLEHKQRTGEELHEVRVTHVFFCKNPKDLHVQPVEGVISRKRLGCFYHRLVRVVKDMASLRGLVEAGSDHHTHEDYYVPHLPLPPSGIRACRTYGGCSYAGICSGTDDPVTHGMALDAANAARQEAERNETTARRPGSLFGAQTNPLQWKQNSVAGGGSIVSMFQDRLNARKAANTGTPVAAQVSANAPGAQAEIRKITQGAADQVFGTDALPPGHPLAPAPQVPPAAPAPPPSVPQAAPVPGAPEWAKAGCGACKGIGWDRKTCDPCRICKASARKREVPHPDDFVIENVGDGTIVWEPKDGINAVGGVTKLVPLEGPPPSAAPTPSQSTSATVSPAQTAPAGPSQPAPAVTSAAPTTPPPAQPAVASGPTATVTATPAPTTAPAAPRSTVSMSIPPAREEAAPTPPAPRPVTVPEPDSEEEESDEEESEGEEKPGDLPKKSRGGRPKGSKNKAKPVVVMTVPAGQATDSVAPTTFSLVAPKLENPQGFILAVNCAVRGFPTEQIVNLEALFKHYATLLASQEGVQNYFMINAFKRRDAMASIAHVVAAHVDGKVVIGFCDTPDMVTFVAALRPLANSEFFGGFSG